MDVIVVDTDEAALEELTSSVEALYPQATVSAFVDPLLAIQHMFKCRNSVLYTALEMKRASGFDIARLFRRAQGGGTVHFIARDERLRRDAESFGAASYTVKPVTAEKLRAAQAEAPQRSS